MRKAIVFAIISFSSFSLMNVLNKVALVKLEISFVSYFFYLKLTALLVLTIFGIITSKSVKFFKPINPKIVVIRAVVLAINTICVTLAVYYLPLDILYSILFILPIAAVVLSYFMLNEIITKQHLLYIILGFAGVLVIINPFSEFNKNLQIIGVILALITVITGAYGGVIVRKHLINENPLTLVFYVFLITGISSICFSLYKYGFILVVPNFIQILLIFFASICTSVGSIFYIKAYQEGAAKFVAPIQYIQILYGSIFGYFIFNDLINYYTILGIIIIIIATYKINKIKE